MTKTDKNRGTKTDKDRETDDEDVLPPTLRKTKRKRSGVASATSGARGEKEAEDAAEADNASTRSWILFNSAKAKRSN